MDNEWYGDAGNGLSGVGNSYDYGFRIYNPRYARFLSVDPLTDEYPWYTPYQFAGNKPIAYVDLDGLEEWYYQDGTTAKEVGPYTDAYRKEKGLYSAEELQKQFGRTANNVANGNRSTFSYNAQPSLPDIFNFSSTQYNETPELIDLADIGIGVVTTATDPMGGTLLFKIKDWDKYAKALSEGNFIVEFDNGKQKLIKLNFNTEQKVIKGLPNAVAQQSKAAFLSKTAMIQFYSSKPVKIAGTIANYAPPLLTAYQVIDGQISVPKAGLDLVMYAVGVYGGPVGWMASGVYFVMDKFVGWEWLDPAGDVIGFLVGVQSQDEH